MNQRTISKIDKTILDNFYKLVHSQPTIRLRAGASTFKILNGLQKSNKSKFNENLNYCVERLVSGLSSSRALARRGYGTLLLEILKTHQVTTDRLLGIASQKFGHVGKDASQDNLFGYYLLIIIILKSENLNRSKLNSQSLERIYKLLVLLRTTKSYFEPAVCRCLVEYNEIFHPFMLSDIPRNAFESDLKLTAFQLLIIVLCNKKEPIKAFLSISNSRLIELSTALLDDKLQNQPLHPIFFELGQCIANNFASQFDKFYEHIITPKFFRANHNELASMGFELTSELLKSISDVNIVKILLSDHLIRTLIISLRSRNSLYEPSVRFFQSLKVTFQKGTDDAVDSKSPEHLKQFTILMQLTSTPGSLAFDEDSKSNSISELLNASSKNVLVKYLERLMLALQKNPRNQTRIDQSIARQCLFIVRRPKIHDNIPIISKVIKYFLVNSLFKINSPCDKFWTSESLPATSRTFDDSVLPSFKNAYHGALEILASVCQPTQRIEEFTSIICFIDKLVKSDNFEYLNESAQETMIELWGSFNSAITEYRKLIKREGDPKQLYPITSVLLLYGFQIIEHTLDCRPQIEELIECAKGALEIDSNDGSWADVTTDQIIALLSATECNPWIRKLSESVFGSLLPHISQNSIDVLCDALAASDHEEDDDVNLDDDGQPISDFSSDGDGDSMDQDSDSGDDEDDDDDDQSMKSVDSTTTPSTRSKDNKASQHSGKNQETGDTIDEEMEDEEEYLGDEEMMKLDGVISQMFLMNRVSKRKDITSIAFKLRCLDLIKRILMKKSNDQDTINAILDAILPLAKATRKSKETRPIWDKIWKMLKKMPAKGKYPKIAEFLEKQK